MPFLGQDRVLGAALGISIACHALLMAVHFRLPDSLRWKPTAQPLEVVLVNAKTRERPSRAELLAQANLDRGGNVDERRRARTPLPVTEPKNPGKDLASAQRRPRELQVQQQQLLAQPDESQARVPKAAERQAPNDQPGGQSSASAPSTTPPRRAASSTATCASPSPSVPTARSSRSSSTAPRG